MNIICPNCGFDRSVNPEALPERAAMATCPKCKHRFKFREIPPLNIPEPQAQEPSLPTTVPPIPDVPLQPATQPKDDDLWDELEALSSEEEVHHAPQPEEPVTPRLPEWERATGGYPQAFAQTMLGLFSNPKFFFRAMPVGQGFTKPLIFFLIIVEFVALSQAIWQLLGILPPSMMTENLGHNLQAALALILYPIQITAFLFLDAGINHLCLKLLKADNKGFEGTFRAAAYSSAPMLLMVVPYIGFPMSMIGVTVYKFLGLRHIHGVDAKRVITAMVLPMILAFILAVALAFLVGRP